jgi:apolipoprotein D and lipocalin family protein
VVSNPRRNVLWILGRTPKMDGAVYAGILAELENSGFDVSKFELTQQLAI